MTLLKYFLIFRKRSSRIYQIQKKNEENSENIHDKNGSQFLQYFAASSACLSLIGVGVSMSWTSPALPYLTSSESSFPITVDQGSWIASINSIGMILGYLINSLLIDNLGRKKALLFLSIPQIFCWVTINFSRNYILVLAARVIGGIGYGGALCTTTTYAAEISEQKTRGFILAMIKMSLNLGIFIVTILGAFLSYNSMNLAILTVPVLFWITFVFAPETPYFYLIKGRDQEAERILIKLRGNPATNLRADPEKNSKNDPDKNSKNDPDKNSKNDPDKNSKNALDKNSKNHPDKNSCQSSENNLNPLSLELKEMKNTISELKSGKNKFFKLLTEKGNRKGLIILLSLSLTELFSGHIVLIAYTQEIMEYSGSSLKAEHATVIQAGFRILASILSTKAVEYLGRKNLLLSSGLPAAGALSFVGLFYFFKNYLKIDVTSFNWIPLLGVSFFEAACAFGISGLYFIFQGELFTRDVRGTATIFSNAAYEIVAFFTKLVFQRLTGIFDIYTIFWMFAVCCVTGTLGTFFIAVETKGKSLEEIQRILSGRKKVENIVLSV